MLQDLTVIDQCWSLLISTDEPRIWRELLTQSTIDMKQWATRGVFSANAKRVYVANFLNRKSYLQAVSQKRHTFLADLELPHFKEKAFVQARIVGYSPRLRKQSSVKCAAHTLIFGLNCSGTVLWIQLNPWFLVLSSFGSPDKVLSLSLQNTASPGHGAGGSNNIWQWE